MKNRGILAGAIVDGTDWELPAIVSAHGNGSNNITATTFAVLPTTTVTAQMTNSHPFAKLLVLAEYGAWLTGAASTNVRACLNVSGSLVVAPGIGGGGPIGWGEVLFAASASSAQHRASCSYELPTSATAATFALWAMKEGANTPALAYGTIRVTPLRYIYD